MIFKQKFRIGLKDIGKENLITNKAIMEDLENIGANHSSSVGYGVLDIERTKASWIVLDWKIKVLKRPKYGQELYIETWARATKHFYTYRDYVIYDDKGNEMVFATSRWTLINIETGKPVRLDEGIVNKFEPEENKNVFNMQELDRLKEPDTFNNMITYKVNRSDIDINGHMHNLYYLDLVYESLPQDVYENEHFNNIRITYKKEIKLGEIVKCKYYRNEDKHIITIVNNEENLIHSIIELQ